MAGDRAAGGAAARSVGVVKQDLLVPRVAEFAHAHSLWHHGQRILVGLSGGPDSVALLHILHKIREKEQILIGALHVNYGLRGAEADGDEEFCQRLCETLDVTLAVVGAGEKPPGNVQAWAREVRREAFTSACEQHGYNRIALGHTADDRAENFVLQLMRGGGPERIGWLPAAAGNLIRPLVSIRREEILEYLARTKTEFRVDRTNYGDRYARNRVRNEVLPLLSAIFGVDAAEVLNAQADLLQVDVELIAQQVEVLWNRVVCEENEIHLAIEDIESYHPAIRLRVFRRMAEALGVHCGRETTMRLMELVEEDPGCRVELGEVTAESGRHSLWMYRRSEPPTPVDMPIPGRLELRGGDTVTAVKASTDPPFPGGRWHARLALPKGIKRWQFRGARAGDRIVPFGMKGSKLVMDLLAEAGIVRHRRPHEWVLVGDDEVFWVVSQRISERGRVYENSQNVYEFVWNAEGI